VSPGTSPWFDAVLSVFIGTNLVTSGIGEHELVIRGEAGMHRVYLSVCAYHDFGSYLGRLKLLIIHCGTQCNYRNLRGLKCGRFFFAVGLGFKSPGTRKAVALGVKISIGRGKLECLDLRFCVVKLSSWCCGYLQ